MIDDATGSQEGQVILGEGARALPIVPPRFQNIFSRPETRNIHFRDQQIALDGRVFVNCRFENCVLDVSSADVDLIACTFDASTTVNCSASVADIARMFEPGFPWVNQHLPAFCVPSKQTDGATTLWLVGKLY